MIDIEKAIKWFENRKGKVSYSMQNRNGSSSYDCSSSVYYALTGPEWQDPGLCEEVVDAHGSDVPAGRHGEIVVEGDTVAKGYFGTRKLLRILLSSRI